MFLKQQIKHNRMISEDHMTLTTRVTMLKTQLCIISFFYLQIYEKNSYFNCNNISDLFFYCIFDWKKISLDEHKTILCETFKIVITPNFWQSIFSIVTARTNTDRWINSHSSLISGQDTHIEKAIMCRIRESNFFEKLNNSVAGCHTEAGQR